MNSKDVQTKKSKPKIVLDNIKSNYILIKIFKNMIEIKSLEMIKINKKLQKRLDISFKYYKEYSQLYSTIEIELNLVDNFYGRFINISDKKDECYCHIYFDNSSEEIKRHYLEVNDNVKIIKIKIDFQIKSFSFLFYGCKCISSINFKKFRRNNITDMHCMFFGCSSLKELNFSDFNTDNVTDMSSIFLGCSSLEKLNLSNFNTNKVINMSEMFFDCSSLEELNLSNFNTDNVKNMKRMFRGCFSLKELNLSNFNAKNVTDMSGMFLYCSSLKKLDISNFNFTNVNNMSYLFFNCSSLEELIVSDFNININDRTVLDGCSNEFKNKIKEKLKK